MLSRLTIKPLIITLLISLSLNGVLAYVSKQFYDAKTEAVYNLKEAEKTIREQQKARELSDKACIIADSVTTSFQKENTQALEDRDKELSAVESIPSKPKKVEVSHVENESNVADIDDRLPPTLISVLSATDSRVQRQTNPNP